MGVARVGGEPHLVTRIGDHVLDLHTLARSGSTGSGAADPDLTALLTARTLNPLLAAGRADLDRSCGRRWSRG